MKRNKELESILKPLREPYRESKVGSFAGFPVELAAEALFAAKIILDKEAGC